MIGDGIAAAVGAMTRGRAAPELGLREYVEAAWHVLEPASPFIPGWHIDAVCEHLEAVTRAEITRLVVNVPPRTMKSLTTCVFWPSWVWTTAPAHRWLFSAYGGALSTRDSVRCRRLIQSPWYQERWGSVFRLTGDQNAKTRYETDASGYRLATSVDGVTTGEGGDTVVVDDPVNYREAQSDLQRATANEWWDLAMSTRLNDQKRGGRVIIMQRLHEDDLTGHVLAAEGGYVHLMLPMRYERRRACVTVLGFSDPRTEEGELLWPARFAEAEVCSLEAQLGPYGTESQLQQSPIARRGGQFERGWFEVLDAAPRGGRILRVRYWDKAGTEGGGAYTAGVLMAHRPSDGITWIEDVVRGQWGAGNRERTIRATAAADAQRLAHMDGTPDKTAVLVVVEQEPGSGGKADAENTVRNLAGYRVEAETAAGAKELRADPLAGAAKNGDVKLVAGAWVPAFLAEMEAAGPGARYVDQRDAAAGAFNRLLRLADRNRTSDIRLGVSDVWEPAWKVS